MNNQKGITLIEVLAALVLVTIVFALVIGIVINSQNNYKRQQSINLNTADMTILLNKMTSEIRKNPDSISATSKKLIITPKTGSPISYLFDSTSNTLSRNGVAQSKKLTDFNSAIEEGILTLTIKDSNAKVWETKIVLRRGTR